MKKRQLKRLFEELLQDAELGLAPAGTAESAALGRDRTMSFSPSDLEGLSEVAGEDSAKALPEPTSMPSALHESSLKRGISISFPGETPRKSAGFDLDDLLFSGPDYGPYLH